jgi:uncharacterized circularly permuted ATP-grasp superfamily protein
LLGEELAMPSVATWWCGEKPALDYVKENFDDLVIKPAYPTQNMEPVFGHELKGEASVPNCCAGLRRAPTPTSLRRWSTCRRGRPGAVQHERRLLARPVGLRAYAVASMPMAAIR